MWDLADLIRRTYGGSTSATTRWWDYLRVRQSSIPLESRSRPDGTQAVLTAAAGSEGYRLSIIGPISLWDYPDLTMIAQDLMTSRPSAIDLYVDSPGGDLFSALALRGVLDQLAESGTTITARGGSVVASAAVPLYLAGATRSLQSYGRMMVHQPRGMFFSSGTLSEIEADLIEFRSVYESARGIYQDMLARTVDTATAETWMTSSEDTWLTAAEAKDHGLVLTILTGTSESEEPEPDDPPQDDPEPAGRATAEVGWYSQFFQTAYGSGRSQ